MRQSADENRSQYNLRSTAWPEWRETSGAGRVSTASIPFRAPWPSVSLHSLQLKRSEMSRSRPIATATRHTSRSLAYSIDAMQWLVDVSLQWPGAQDENIHQSPRFAASQGWSALWRRRSGPEEDRSDRGPSVLFSAKVPRGFTSTEGAARLAH